MAKESIEKVKREAQAVEQSRQKLETDIAKMKRSILELTEANSDLEKMKISLREEREDLKKYEGELVEAQIIEARALEAYVWYENNLKAKAFRFLNIATEYSKVKKNYPNILFLKCNFEKENKILRCLNFLLKIFFFSLRITEFINVFLENFRPIMEKTNKRRKRIINPNLCYAEEK